jgi:NAD+ synthase
VSGTFPSDALELDAKAKTGEICAELTEIVLKTLRKRGAVVALSGGIDSSVVAGLCARALGPERVLAVLMPERDSADDTLELSRSVAEAFGVETVTEEITGILDATGCYVRRDLAFAAIVPEYGPGWKAKIVLPPLMGTDTYRVFSVVAQSPDGELHRRRVTLDAYRQIVAATNFKQRVRKMLEYYHADRLDYAVVGTPNRLEYDLGFFVRNGDGSADVKPIAHLYKSQVYRIAEALGVPEAVRKRTPTTDTYALAQDQEEFYFALPYEQMDLCLFGRLHGFSPEETAEAVGISAADAERVYRDIDAKRRVAEILSLPALTIADTAGTPVVS